MLFAALVVVTKGGEIMKGGGSDDVAFGRWCFWRG